MNFKKIFSFIHTSIFYIFEKQNFDSIYTRIIKTPIFGFFPNANQHHIVLLTNTNKKQDIYSVDFTPINQSDFSTLFKLAIARNVPAEIRLRHFKNISIFDDNKIIKNWNELNKCTWKESIKMTNKVFSNIRDSKMKNKIKKIRTWKNEMNLYNHNCQHFSFSVIHD
jgi:hypothetical protein